MATNATSKAKPAAAPKKASTPKGKTTTTEATSKATTTAKGKDMGLTNKKRTAGASG